jgi:tripartite-type tricarboxylate transporter receptor subunit TctC
MVTNTTHAANLALYKKLPYDPVKDFEPITKTSEAPMVLVVHPDSPYRTAAEFFAAVKARKPMSFAAASATGRVAGEMLKIQLNGELLHIPYKTGAQGLNDVMGKQVDFMPIDTGTGLPLIKGGKVRPLAVSSSRRDVQLPTVPTFTESGLDLVLVGWSGIAAPAGTPARIIEQLNAWLRQVTQVQTVRDRMLQTGVTPAVSTSGQEFRAYLQSEISFWTRAVKAAGIEPE